MKKKYVVMELNGWDYAGKHYNQFDTVDLSDIEFEGVKHAVRLELAKAEPKPIGN